MRIRRLRLNDYRTFDDLSIELSPGLNVIRGPNESGKSTVASAVVAGLFEKAQSRNAAVRAAWRWGEESGPVVELDLEHEGEELRLVKDFGQKKARLEADGGEVVEGAKAIDARVGAMTGFSDPSQYLRTACVTHDQMVGLAEDAGAARKLATMLREVVVGGRDSATLDSAIKDLSTRVDELRRGLERPASNPGTIRRLQGEREATIERQRSLTGAADDMEANRERLEEIEAGLEDKAPALSDLEGLLEKNSELSALEAKGADARKRFEDAEKVRDIESRLSGVCRKIEAEYAVFDALDPRAETELRREIEMRASLSRLLEELRGELDAAGGVVPRPRGRVAWALLGAGLVLLLLGVGLGLVNPWLFSLGGAGALLAAAGVYMLRVSVGPGDGGAALIREKLEKSEQEVEKLEGREREFLKSLGCEDPESFFTAISEYRELAAERDRLDAGRKALLGDRSESQVEEERRRAAVDETSARSLVEELEPFRLSPERLQAVTRERDSLESEVESLKKERDALCFHMSRSSLDPEELLSLEETVSFLWDEEQRARRRLRVYTLALDGLTDARAAMLSSAVPVLAEGIGRTLHELTGGRYSEVEVQEDDLAISVYSPDRGALVGADELLSTLSKGTVSQVYLAARLHLVDSLSGDRKPPLLFDDSFSYFDDTRLAALWEMLLDRSAGQQVLLFTCTSRYDGLIGPGVNVIDLPGR